MNRVLVAILFGLVLSACTAAGGTPTTETGSTRIDEASRRVEVTDVTAQVRPRPELLAKPQRRLLSSAAAYRGFFGQDPPASIDFDRQWVVFATLGPQGSSGHGIEVQVRLHPSGRSLRAGIVTTTPGTGCVGESSPDAPFFVAAIPAGAGKNIPPQAIRYFSKVDVHDCAPTALCGPALEQGLQKAATAADGEPVLAVSESDNPYTPVTLGAAPAQITVAAVAEAALASGIFDDYLQDLREGADEFPETNEEILAKLIDDEDGGHESWGSFSSSSGDFVTWFEPEPLDESADDWTRNQALGHVHMSEVLRQNLEDVTLVYLFDVEVKLLIVGRTSCGQLAGYVTTLIWT